MKESDEQDDEGVAAWQAKYLINLSARSINRKKVQKNIAKSAQYNYYTDAPSFWLWLNLDASQNQRLVD